MAWINEIYDTLYDENTICIACISHGKDSLSMLRAIKHLGLPLHRIVHTEVWATQTIPADLPPMVEFKKKADQIIKELYGIEVEHICATKNNSQSVNVERERERERELRRHLLPSSWNRKICREYSWIPLQNRRVVQAPQV